MSDNTLIEWADATVNAVNGCSVLSPGCTNCYAMKLAGTRLKNHPSRAGLTQPSKAGPVWTGEVRLNEDQLLQPLSWKRPRRIFWNAHGDLFHPAVPDEWIDRVFAVCALTPQHTHMILTKRPRRMRAYVNDPGTPGRIARRTIDLIIEKKRAFPDPWPVRSIGDIDDPSDITLAEWPLPNVWLGTSAEDQTRADERIAYLRATPAEVRFISFEPLLGPVFVPNLAGIDWVIVGGESGPGARPMHPDWARSLRDQCAQASVPFFFKQNGEFAPGEIAGDYLNPTKPARGLSLFDGKWSECWSEVDGHVDDEPDVYRIGKKAAGRLLDGRLHSEFPA